MSTIIKLPQQKKSFKSKSKTWKEDTINSIDSGISYLTNQEVRRSVIEKTIAFAETQPKVGILGCRVLNQDLSLQPTCFMYPSLLNTFLSACGY